MSGEIPSRILPEGFERGPVQGRNVIGDVTESLQRFLLDGWDLPTARPRLEEDLSFVPKDREEVIYTYMYRVSRNTALMNSKHWRPAKFDKVEGAPEGMRYFERPPLYLDLHYLIGVHAKFRSDAERLLGWVLTRLYDATHIVYRPRKYLLPSGGAVDSTGAAWAVDADGDDVIMEKVALDLIDDMTIGDAINFFTIHEAPYRPFLTYRARCAMEGSLIATSKPTTIRTDPLEGVDTRPPAPDRPGGRLGRISTRPASKKNIGPPGRDHVRLNETDSEE